MMSYPAGLPSTFFCMAEGCDWRGGGICVNCGAVLRCVYCGRFMREDSEHVRKCHLEPEEDCLKGEGVFGLLRFPENMEGVDADTDQSNVH